VKRRCCNGLFGNFFDLDGDAQASLFEELPGSELWGFFDAEENNEFDDEEPEEEDDL